ncbi:PAS domain S-box protein [Thiohalophilus sp.]|uniref:PAS domain S-box protein n=1 Tax=Thiohalophilus sp. TaxID=3028392 RepID=UPI003976617C
MQPPAIPENESARLQSLLECRILDTPDDERFDRLTRLAKELFDVSIVLVSLVDAERQWFKSRQGLEACETGRDISFCGHAILNTEIFQVTDAATDPRFADNPLVTGPPHIRFYAGAPLATAAGYRIGTLCLIDETPRQLNERELTRLRDLADAVQSEIETQHQQRRADALGTLTQITSQSDIDPESALRQALALGCEYLGMPFGIISRIEDEDYCVQLQVSPPDTLHDHQHFPLGETYCSLALEHDTVLSIAHMAQSQYSGHPCYQSFGLESYVGVSIVVQGERYGTLNFSSPDEHAARYFDQAEIEFVELLGQWVSSTLQRWQLDQNLKSQQQLSRIIAAAQAQFIEKTDRREAFDGLLSDILSLTDSEYGFIGEVLHTSEGTPYLKTYAITNIAWNDETRDFYATNAPQGMEFYNLKSLFGAALISGEPVIANDPCQDPRRAGLPEGHPPLNAFLGIPIYHSDELVAMLGIANRPAGYDTGLIDFLSPLRVTIGQLIVAAQLQQRHQKDQLELMRLSRVASQTTNGVIITDIEGRIEWVNEGFTRITGYTADEIQGRKPGELLQGPDTDPATVAQIRSALSRGEGFAADLVNYTQNGRPYWVRIQCSPLHDETGKLQGFMAIESDVTQERDDADRVRASERRLASVIEGTNIGTWEWNVQSGETLFNERWAEIVGYSLDELAPISIQTWMDLVHPEDLQRSGELLEQHFAGEIEFYDCMARMRHKAGHWVWVHDRGRLVSRTAEGAPLLMSGTHADITEQKQAEIALQGSEARLRGLFELSPLGIALNDYETGAFVDLNQSLLEPTGYRREEFLALSYWDLTPREYEPQEAQQLESMKKTGRYGPYEKEYIRKDGNRYPVLLNGMVVYDNSGRKLIWSIVEDISERKRIERMKDEFVSTVSHELRTPLTSIRGALNLIRGKSADTLEPKPRRMLEIAERNSERLSHIINDLLDMDKLIAGKMHFDLQACSIREIIEQALADNQAYADKYGVTFTRRYSTDINVMADSQRLLQVLANLLSNAAKFSPAGGTVEVSSRVTDSKVRVEVRDQGSGMSEEFQEKVFQKFMQADASDTRQKGGSGLGLAISKELIEHMEGKIGFESIKDNGSVFFFELPVCKVTEL